MIATLRQSAGQFLRRLGQGLALAFWLRPRARVELGGFGGFLAACALALLAFMLHDYHLSEQPSDFFIDGFHAHASYFFALLIAAWLAARVLQRPALWLTLATLTVLIGIPWTAISIQASEWLADADVMQLQSWRILLSLAGFVAVFRTVGYLAGASAPRRRLGASLLFVLVMTWPWAWQQSAWFWYPPEEMEEDPAQVPDVPLTVAKVAFDSERVLYRQPELLQKSIEAVQAQTPGKIDLFAIGFAGDGSERVFRNEVEFFNHLMAQRFDASTRTLSLINAPDTVETVPLATLSNLRAALAGVAARMDTSEDVLVLFLTSHGSEDHRLFVGLEPLPLRQIRPQDLRTALDDAGIQWRVVVVSSCYSGGFVDALRDQDTLVITAARADRTSFGCGGGSQITWFGKAFLAQALNETTDFERGFALASKQVREWELAQGETASVPQMAGGWAIRRKLAAWRETLAPAGAVAFSPR